MLIRPSRTGLSTALTHLQGDEGRDGVEVEEAIGGLGVPHRRAEAPALLEPLTAVLIVTLRARDDALRVGEPDVRRPTRSRQSVLDSAP